MQVHFLLLGMRMVSMCTHNTSKHAAATRLRRAMTQGPMLVAGALNK